MNDRYHQQPTQSEPIPIHDLSYSWSRINCSHILYLLFLSLLSSLCFGEVPTPLSQINTSSLTINSTTPHPSHLHPSHSIHPCGDDIFEPNNQRHQARNISTMLRTGREISAMICRSDQDWYSFWLNRGQLVEIILQKEDSTSPPTLQVFAPRHRKPSGILRRKRTAHVLKVYAKRSGRYRIKVEGRGKKHERERYRFTFHPLIDSQ